MNVAVALGPARLVELMEQQHRVGGGAARHHHQRPGWNGVGPAARRPREQPVVAGIAKFKRGDLDLQGGQDVSAIGQRLVEARPLAISRSGSMRSQTRR